MPKPGNHIGICGIAVVRAADAMLRSLGGEEISLLLPLLGMPDDPVAQLGLVDPGVEEIKLSPVVVRNLQTENTGPRRRVEFLVPASAVAAELASRNVASARAFFDSALGAMHQGELFHIEGIATEYVGGRHICIGLWQWCEGIDRWPLIAGLEACVIGRDVVLSGLSIREQTQASSTRLRLAIEHEDSLKTQTANGLGATFDPLGLNCDPLQPATND